MAALFLNKHAQVPPQAPQQAPGPAAPAAAPPFGASGPTLQGMQAAGVGPAPAAPAAPAVPGTPMSPDQVQDQVMTDLLRRYKFLGDFELSFEWKKVDLVQGYYIGQILVAHPTMAPQTPGMAYQGGTIDNPTIRDRESEGSPVLRIPVIVKAHSLKKVDEFVAPDRSTWPISEDRVREAMQTKSMTELGPKGDVLYDPTLQTAPGATAMSYMPASMGGTLGNSSVAMQGPLKFAGHRARLLQAQQKQAAWGGENIDPEAPSDLEAPAPRGIEAPEPDLVGAGLSRMPQPRLQEFQYALSQPDVQQQVLRNKALRVAAMRILQTQPSTEDKAAEVILDSVPADVVELSLPGGTLAGGMQMKTGRARAWSPRVRTFSPEWVQDHVPLELRTALVKAAAAGRPLLLTPDVSHLDEPFAHRTSPVVETGIYALIDKTGAAREGLVISEVLDVQNQPTGQMLFVDRSEPVHGFGKIAGARCADRIDDDRILGERFRTTPTGYGCFVFSKVGNDITATEPLRVKHAYQDAEGTNMLAASLPVPLGHPQRWTSGVIEGAILPVSGIRKMAWLRPGILAVPADWNWVELGTSTELLDGPSQEKTAQLGRLEDRVVLTRDGESQYTVQGAPLEKLSVDRKRFLLLDEAAFLLGGLGAPAAQIPQLLEKAAQGPIELRTQRRIVPFSEHVKTAQVRAQQISEYVDRLRPDVLTLVRTAALMEKRAAVLGNPQAVDTVLSLGLMTPDNLQTYVDHVDTIDKALRIVADLLLLTRLTDQPDLPEPVLERGMTALDRVAIGLRSLRSRINDMSETAPVQ